MENNFFENSIKNRILVMDDNPAIQKSARKFLEHLGCEVSIASNGPEAISLYKKLLAEKKTFNLVILDLNIPGGMGGEETLRKLLEVDPDTNAVISSDFLNETIIVYFLNRGFKAALLKPFSLDELEFILRETIDSD